MASSPGVIAMEQDQPPQPQAHLASRAHTLVLVLLLLGVSVLTAKTPERVAARNNRLPTYLATMALEWALVAYVAWGVRKQNVKVRELIGGRWGSPEDAILDVAIAAGFWILAIVVLSALGFAFGLSGKSNLETAKKSLEFLVPRTGLELGLWVALSATAGFAEEIIYRGYLQRQFAALAGNVYLGLLASALLFGLSHGYEGPKRMVIIAVYGAMFGLVAKLRRSLRPGMMAHAWHDAATGVALYLIFVKHLVPMP